MHAINIIDLYATLCQAASLRPFSLYQEARASLAIKTFTVDPIDGRLKKAFYVACRMVYNGSSEHLKTSEHGGGLLTRLSTFTKGKKCQ